MKRLLHVVLVTVVLASLLSAQNATIAPFEEPENHAITVERLMRYHDSGEYEREIREVVNSARDYVESRYPGHMSKESKLAAVFDIDETALSNWDIMAFCGFCSYPAQLQLYQDGPYSMNDDPVISPVLELFNFLKDKGIAIFFVTGREENTRQMTIANLHKAGYSDWAGIYMHPDVPKGKTKTAARIFKPMARQQIVDKGYEIVLNIGDQASDLAGCCALRVFKLPNPFYLLP